jgi:hypothetical protein
MVLRRFHSLGYVGSDGSGKWSEDSRSIKAISELAVKKFRASGCSRASLGKEIAQIAFTNLDHLWMPENSWRLMEEPVRIHICPSPAAVSQ